MMEELGCQAISPGDAALRLACQRARHISETGEDSLPSMPSMPHFHHLTLAGDRLEEVYELAYFDDDDIFYSDDPGERRTCSHEV